MTYIEYIRGLSENELAGIIVGFCVASVDTVLSDMGYEPKINIKDANKLKREIKDVLKSEMTDTE